jgi:hypothetical protein
MGECHGADRGRSYGVANRILDLGASQGLPGISGASWRGKGAIVAKTGEFACQARQRAAGTSAQCGEAVRLRPRPVKFARGIHLSDADRFSELST